MRVERRGAPVAGGAPGADDSARTQGLVGCASRCAVCDAERVARPDEIQGAFRRAIDSGGPALVEIIVEREADASMGVSLDAIREFEPLPITYDQPVGTTPSR